MGVVAAAVVDLLWMLVVVVAMAVVLMVAMVPHPPVKVDMSHRRSPLAAWLLGDMW